MRIFFLFIIFVLFSTVMFAQNISGSKIIKKVKVQGSVINVKSKQVQENELIIFKSLNTNQDFEIVSDAKGNFVTELPVGDRYRIFIADFIDSVTDNILAIPELEAGEIFEGPFIVNLEFDPASNFVLENVEFDIGKATLRPQSLATLNHLIEYLKRKSSVHIEIAGFTDNIGPRAENQKLSFERARSVFKFLNQNGISEERMTIKGYGDSKPITDNNSEEGRQKNRRIEITIIDSR
jgi:outer membrane protein OmpA-like peptidoglycan-associated protein